jgi:hypothetical protein
MTGQLALSRSLSPACCKVLIALVMAGSALDVAGLETWTGLERVALGRALNLLKGLDLVVPQTGAHNRQTWVPAGDSFFSAFQLGQKDATEPYLLTTTIEARAPSKQVIQGQLGQNDATGNWEQQQPDQGPPSGASWEGLTSPRRQASTFPRLHHLQQPGGRVPVAIGHALVDRHADETSQTAV